jgi:hypothetical protein
MSVLLRPYRALRHGGKFPALKRRAEPGRKAGFESVIKDYPNLRVVTELQGHSSRANGKAIMESLLQKYAKGQLQALVAQNEMALGASSASRAPFRRRAIRGMRRARRLFAVHSAREAAKFSEIFCFSEMCAFRNFRKR